MVKRKIEDIILFMCLYVYSCKNVSIIVYMYLGS